MKKTALLLALALVGILSYWPFPNAMSCWTAGNEGKNKAAAAAYSERSNGDFSAVSSFVLSSDFRLPNFHASKENIVTYVYVTNYRNLSCWYLDIISIDGSIIRLDVSEDDGIENRVISVH